VYISEEEIELPYDIWIVKFLHLSSVTLWVQTIQIYVVYIGIPINLVYTAAQGYPWKSGLHCCTGISLEILFTLLYMDILGNLVYTAVQGYPWYPCTAVYIRFLGISMYCSVNKISKDIYVQQCKQDFQGYPCTPV
jgi:hypothetical protein